MLITTVAIELVAAVAIELVVNALVIAAFVINVTNTLVNASLSLLS